jgi:histone deacetylase 6
MIAQCMLFANGKVMACLEGGYNVHSISMSALACINTLSGHGHKAPPLRPSLPSQSIVNAVQYTIGKNKTFWRSFGLATQATVSSAIACIQQQNVIEKGLPY